MKNGTIVNISSTNGTKTISPEYIAEETAKIYIERFADPSEIATQYIFFRATNHHILIARSL